MRQAGRLSVVKTMDGREAGLGHADSDNRFAVSGMTLRIKWDRSGSDPFNFPLITGIASNKSTKAKTGLFLTNF